MVKTMKKNSEKSLKAQEIKEKNIPKKQQEMQIDILDSIRALVFLKDKENRFIWVNKAFAGAMEMSKKELEGKSMSEIYTRELSKKYMDEDKEVISSGKPKFGIIDTIKSSDGNPMWLQTDKIPYCDNKGNVVGVVGFCVDITEIKIIRERLMENQEKFRILFESSSDPMMTLEPPRWNYSKANEAALKLFGMKSENDFYAFCPCDLSPERQPDGQLSIKKAKKMIEKTLKEGASFFEWKHKKYKGEEFMSTILLSRMQFKDKVFLQATVRDISIQKEAEVKLKEKIEEIEKMNKFMIGRELKMIELKKKIQELEKNKII